MSEDNKILVRAKSVVKLNHVGGSHVDMSIQAGNDLVKGLNDALRFAGINKKLVLVDND